MQLVLLAHCMIKMLAIQCKSGKSTVIALGTVHLVESPGNEGTSGSFSLYIMRLIYLSAICSILCGQSLCTLSIICVWYF